jgi:hypothetical protein
MSSCNDEGLAAVFIIESDFVSGERPGIRRSRGSNPVSRERQQTNYRENAMEDREIGQPVGAIGEAFPPCDQRCAQCAEWAFVVNMKTSLPEWKCPNATAVTSYTPEETLAMTYQDYARICPDMDVSPFILGLYERHAKTVYRIIDRAGNTRLLESEFVVKRDEHDTRIAMLGITRLLRTLNGAPNRKLGVRRQEKKTS